MTSAKPPVLENGRPSEATKRILTVLSYRGPAIVLRYPTRESASSMAHCSDPGGETSHFPEKGYAQLPCAHRVCLNVKLNFIPTEESGPTASLAQPENFLVALFVLSPTVWIIVFLGCYLSAYLAGSISSVLRGTRLFESPRLVTLFPNGTPTTRATFPG
jgi:hypothetical protein